MDNSQPSVQQPSYPPGQFSWSSTSSVGFRSLFYNSQEKLIPPLFSRNDRSQRYKVHLDVAPTLLIFLYIVMAFLFIVTCLLIGMFAAPPGTSVVRNLVPYNADYFTFQRPIVVENSGYSVSNLNLMISFAFTFNNSYVDISKSDFSMNLEVEGRPTTSTPSYERIVVDTVTRTLTCTTGVTYYLQIPGPNGNILKTFHACNNVDLFYLSYLHYGDYRVSFQFNNIFELWERHVIVGDILVDFQSENSSYVTYEIILRSMFSFVAFVSFIWLTIVLWKVQQFGKWHTTQKWLSFILFFEIFFQDPFYILGVLYGGWFYPLYTTFFSMTFMFLFLLYLLIFVHGLLVKPSERYFFKFYLPKFLLIIVSWVVAMTVMMWSKIYNIYNPSSVRVYDVPGYSYFFYTEMSLLIIYAGYLLYYVLRALGSINRFKTKYSTRFKVVGSLSLFVLFAFIVVLLVQNQFVVTDRGFAFILTHGLVLCYFTFLAIFFTPSGTPEPGDIILNDALGGDDSSIKPVEEDNIDANAAAAAAESASASISDLSTKMQQPSANAAEQTSFTTESNDNNLFDSDGAKVEEVKL